MNTIANSILPGTINIFVNSLCNFACKHCYATFQDIAASSLAKLSEADAKAIIRAIANEPMGDDLLARKITFVGGEPTLHPSLPSLVAYAKDLGLVTAVITNGLTLSPRYLKSFTGKLDWVGLSIDAVDCANKEIGRATRAGRYLDADAYLQRIEWIQNVGAQLKINTVVSRLNHMADLSEFIALAKPIRWKVLQVTPVEGQNDRFIELLKIDRSAFDAFVDRHRVLDVLGIRMVAEYVETIRGSYAMISPDGRFFDSAQGRHQYSRRILEVGMASAFQDIFFDPDKYEERDGNYNPFTGESHSLDLKLVDCSR
jgi:radical S-adenosyl methionine domain-containing protein 2